MRRIFASVLLVCFPLLYAGAQTTAQVTGTVLDASGALGRNPLQGPGNWNFDAAIWRTFPISERFKLDFRAEAFNALNHLQIGNPGTGIFTGNINVANPNGVTGRSNTAGYIGSAANQPRTMQLALKLTF